MADNLLRMHSLATFCWEFPKVQLKLILRLLICIIPYLICIFSCLVRVMSYFICIVSYLIWIISYLICIMSYLQFRSVALGIPRDIYINMILYLWLRSFRHSYKDCFYKGCSLHMLVEVLTHKLTSY